MFKRKVISYAIVGVLTVGVAGMGTSIFAMTSQNNDSSERSTKVISSHDRIEEIKDELKAQGITLPDEDMDRDEYLANLDAATKKRLEEFAKDLKAEDLSSEEALELRKQRISSSNKANKTEQLMNVDDEGKTLVKEILEKTWNGDITVDEAVAGLEALEINLTDQQIRDLQTYFNSEISAETKDIYNKLKEGKISEDEAREEITKRRISSPDNEENE